MMYRLDDFSSAPALPSTEPKGQPMEQSTLPEDVLILIPVRNVVLFPHVVLPIVVGREPLLQRWKP